MSKPSDFQRLGRRNGPGYNITGAYASVTGEQRRRILIRELDVVLKNQGWPDITVDADGPEGGVSYIPDFSRNYEDSIVRVDLVVPAFVDARGKVRHEINVPPCNNWSQRVLEVVLVYIANWAAKLARP